MTTIAYQLSEHGRELVELLVEAREQGDAELAAALEDLRDSMLAQQDDDPAEVLASLGRDRRELEAREAGAAAERDRLKRRAAGFRRAAETVRETALVYMLARGLERVDDVARRQTNGGKLPVSIQEDVDPAALPSRFQRVSYAVDTDAVREALEAGEELPWAKLEERGQHVRWEI